MSKISPLHPGEILNEEFLKPMKLSRNSLALSIKVSARRINEIVNGKRRITADTALRLAKYFDTTPQFWLGLQMDYDLDIAENRLAGKLDKEIQVYKPAIQEFKEIIQKYIKAYNSFDIDGMLELMHENIEFQNISDGKINLTTNGLKELRYAAEYAKSLFESRMQKIIKYSFENDTVSIEIDYEGVLCKDIPDGPKSGERLKLKGKSVFKFKDGKIVSLTDYS